MEAMLNKLNEASAHEVDVRYRNNELYDLTQSTSLSLDTLRKIDNIQAKKARSILLGHSEANPWAVTAINSMMSAMSDSSTEAVEALVQVLEELVAQRQAFGQGDARHKEITLMIDTIEKMLVVYATEARARNDTWWLPTKRER